MQLPPHMYYDKSLCFYSLHHYFFLSRNIFSLKDMKDQVVSRLFYLLTTVYKFSYLNHEAYFNLKGVFCSILFTHSEVQCIRTMPVFGATGDWAHSHTRISWQGLSNRWHLGYIPKVSSNWKSSTSKAGEKKNHVFSEGTTVGIYSHESNSALYIILYTLTRIEALGLPRIATRLSADKCLSLCNRCVCWWWVGWPSRKRYWLWRMTRERWSESLWRTQIPSISTRTWEKPLVQFSNQ